MITVYHGSLKPIRSPSLSEEHSLSGTGVAHQGAGFYVTTSPELAEHYRHPDKGILYEADLYDDRDFPDMASAPDEAFVKQLLESLCDEDKLDFVIDTLSGATYQLRYEAVKEKIYSYLINYDSDLIDELGDFDLEDPDAVISLLEELKQTGLEMTPGDDWLTLYKQVATVLGSELVASQRFAALGVPGMHYQDGRTREYGADVKNYVVFDVNKIKHLSEISPVPSGQPGLGL